MAALVEGFRALDQPVEPLELVVELGAGLGIAVRQVQASDDDPLHRRLDVAALLLGRIAGKSSLGFDRIRILREDRHAVPRLLAVPYRAVARLADFRDGKGAL